MKADKARTGAARGGRRPSQWATGLLAAVAVLALLAGCSKTPAEQRLRERIAAMERAIEERQGDAFMAGVAGNFIGSGGVDRQALRRLVALHLLRNAAVSAVMGPLDISIEGDQARVAFTVVVTGGRGGLLPERGQSISVESQWRDGSGGWQVVTADWDERF